MKKQKPVVRRQFSRIVIILAFLLFLSGIISLGYRWYIDELENRYLLKIEEIQRKANEKLDRLNRRFVNFESDPRIAKKILPQFKEAQEILEEAADELETIKPVPKAKVYHGKLILLYTKSVRLAGNLASVAEYLETREKLFLKLGRAVETFGKRVKEAQSDEKVIEEATALRKKTDDILNRLKKLSPPLKIYSGALLQQYLEELSQSLTGLEKAIEKKDIPGTQTAVTELNQVLSQDWSKTFFETDAKGIKSYEKQVEEIDQLQGQITR